MDICSMAIFAQLSILTAQQLKIKILSGFHNAVKHGRKGAPPACPTTLVYEPRNRQHNRTK